ncbi:SDR family NAD(P)-dependent oxidoreductase [Ottowia thiooxydans]|uniref:SDR family NAD(P)-dependent oxidoreductase n=1 Tax=Ottowia thiooxydans TaxID=219182 RepID=UPI0004278919|nr:SDR family oxidoreductase [Ottowia thiooxydans]
MFDDTIALVSGASQGIGLACVKRLLQAGCRVAMADIALASAQAAIDQMEIAPDRCRAFQLDVRDAAQCASVVAQVRAIWGPLGILVNNAGVSGRKDCMEGEALSAEVDRLMDVNVKGVLNLSMASADDLKATRGAIVNVASLTSFVATRAHIAYGASKGAVAQLTKFLARDLGPFGVRVNAVAPGLVMTPLTQHIASNPEHLRNMVERTFLKVPAQPDDIAGPVVFLASAMAAHVTGVVLPVDGGYLAN